MKYQQVLTAANRLLVEKPVTVFVAFGLSNILMALPEGNGARELNAFIGVASLAVATFVTPSED